MRATKSSQLKKRSKAGDFGKKIQQVVKTIPFPVEIREDVELRDLDISVINAEFDDEHITIEEPRISALIAAEASFIFACDSYDNLIDEDDFPTTWDEDIEEDSLNFTTVSGVKFYSAKDDGANPAILALEEDDDESLIQYSLDDSCLSDASLGSVHRVVPVQADFVEEAIITKKKPRTIPGYLKGTCSSAKKRRAKSPSRKAQVFRCA